MLLNKGKCHFNCLEINTENKTFVFRNKKNSGEQKILGKSINEKQPLKVMIKIYAKSLPEKTGI